MNVRHSYISCWNISKYIIIFWLASWTRFAMKFGFARTTQWHFHNHVSNIGFIMAHHYTHCEFQMRKFKYHVLTLLDGHLSKIGLRLLSQLDKPVQIWQSWLSEGNHVGWSSALTQRMALNLLVSKSTAHQQPVSAPQLLSPLQGALKFFQLGNIW